MEDITKSESRKRWVTRRKMTWIIFWTMIGSFVYGLYKIPAENLEQYASLYTTFFTFGSAVIVAYFGFATYDDVKHNEMNNSASEKAVDENDSS